MVSRFIPLRFKLLGRANVIGLVCGTLALANAVRSSLSRPRFMDILKGGPSITLHIEAYGNLVSWANLRLNKIILNNVSVTVPDFGPS